MIPPMIPNEWTDLLTRLKLLSEIAMFCSLTWLSTQAAGYIVDRNAREDADYDNVDN